MKPPSPEAKTRTGAANLDHALKAGIHYLGDFTTDPRVLLVSAIAVVVGIGGLVSGLL